MNISLSEKLTLVPITIDKFDELNTLMHRIYPPAYKYLWHDDGSWYLDQLYNIDNVKKDIEEPDGDFYLVQYEAKYQGILKLQYKTPFPDMPEKRAFRLHRIYLAEEVQGLGVSKAIMKFVIEKAKDQNSEIIWLDCMDTKHQALNYYKKFGFQTGTLSKLKYELLIKGSRGIFLMWKEL